MSYYGKLAREGKTMIGSAVSCEDCAHALTSSAGGGRLVYCVKRNISIARTGSCPQAAPKGAGKRKTPGR